ncbi:MAG: DUF2391 family protein [Bdellovibrionales bacterium]|nr:DUF2391 family protein [Bdellovibrionales bacterium]
MTSEKNTSQSVSIERLGRGRYLHTIIPIVDSTGEVIERIVKPLMVELHLRDIVQILVGSAMLAVPVGFTEETWNLGERLPTANVLAIAAISLFFIATFVYVNFYRFYLKDFSFEYIKRVLAIYLLSLLVVGILLTVIQQCPWGIDNILAAKRIIIVAFPASMSAALTDSLK